VTLSPLLSFWGLPPPPRSSRSCSSLTPAHEVRFLPLTLHFLCTALRFCTVGILLTSFTVGAELSKPFAKYLSISAMWSCRGTLQLVTSASRPRFAFGKALAVVTLVGRHKRFDCFPSPSFFYHPLGLRPVAWLRLHTFPSRHLRSWHLTAPLSAVDLRSLYKIPPQLRQSSWPSLMPLWHTLRRPLIRVTSIHPFILPSGTASSPGTLLCAGPYFHFLAQADPRHLSDANFVCQGFIHSLCFYTFVVDVTKGSPLFPACFFPFHSLPMYAYICRIWLGDRRDVRLVSYQSDLGVWMFPVVRREWFLFTIALKLNAVFVH